jgi:2-hydroxy-6-oxonona-2,4-dienedioate hydrolase
MNEQRFRDEEQRVWEMVGASPEESHVFLPSTGTTVRVQQVGEGDPVLFLHGGTNAGMTWAPLVAHLPGFRCLVVDRPGAGLSPACAVTSENLPALADAFVRDVLDGLHLDRADVVASSLGGYLALRSAAATPGRITRLVNCSSPALVPGMLVPSSMRRVVTRPWVRALAGAVPPSRAGMRMLLRQMGHRTGPGLPLECFVRSAMALQRYTATMRNDWALLGDLITNLPSVTLTDELLESVTTPALFLWGEQDPFGGPEVAVRVAGAMPSATLTLLPGSGHLTWLDDPARVAAEVSDFLSDTAIAPSRGNKVSGGA